MKGKRVSSDEELFRRSYPSKKYVNPDGTATSRVFKPRPKDGGLLSVDVASLTTSEVSVFDINKYGLYQISVNAVELVGLHADHDPMTLEHDGVHNPAHALIVSIDDNDEIIPGLLARSSRRIL